MKRSEYGSQSESEFGDYINVESNDMDDIEVEILNVNSSEELKINPTKYKLEMYSKVASEAQTATEETQFAVKKTLSKHICCNIYV